MSAKKKIVEHLRIYICYGVSVMLHYVGLYRLRFRTYRESIKEKVEAEIAVPVGSGLEKIAADAEHMTLSRPLPPVGSR